MNKKKFILFAFAIIALFAAVFYFSKKNDVPTEEAKHNPTKINVQSSEKSKAIIEKKSYPASVVGDQEVSIVARTSGVITNAPLQIGSFVRTGSLLARIDDAGRLGVGDKGFRSSEIQQSEISKEKAKESYSLSKDAYREAKKSDTSTKLEKETAETEKEIAKLEYESAKIDLQSAIDNHIITSPINGFVIGKNVSAGDFVSAGQTIATLSKTSNLKIQFYVDQTEKTSFLPGQQVSVTDSAKKEISAAIKNISVQADPQTKRFLVEAYPQKQDASSLSLGTIVTISLERKHEPQNYKNFILPLSAITITQNENYIFVAENNTAKKITVEVVRIIGENAEISGSISPETLIIIKGNKVLREGETVSIENNF
ncbi:MAG: efflux transporter, RND family, MFP subunit [uncultured bacterium]|nr:MAG: efflux transporter, RND family, MFP subunit [uncultured bacterium]HCU70479.1 hypothetical protein [Candidatus Moranbacteria bacterium]